MKKFNEFVNEGLTDKMKPKSEEEIEKSLDNLSPYEKIEKIFKNKLENLFKKEYIINILNKIPIEQKNKLFINVCEINNID